MKIQFNTLATASLALALAAGVSYAQEVHIPFSQLPPAVQQAVQQQKSHGATVRGYVSDRENGRTEYEVETIRHGMTRDISIDAAGHVLEVEQQVPLSQVPAAAKAAIQKGAAGGHLIRVEKVTSSMSSEVAYEAGIRAHGRYHEVRVHPDGSPAPESD
ncbi:MULTISPECIES: PepSY domain-containing protein [Acidobacterium]|uniref:PepSY domain-containing protein n=1 Tax=Acidobacterium capsulatum (strain ATCC 51196 / DSM 11244 / BCRC 80197 / JCM 7670 / NBRC 15755 / NCIMB 13165 / 161) TaxID=240015 RepID=C1F8H0_ACIC5|nr:MULTISPECIES: PepSY domain-containing protein [Acidobacterium]ACO34663.1 hypothetical protein ACP_0094 [Acidobacterium capsulatum ATCC 51196]HCT59256.1 hypothetical protein [Acidobacterium sp.]